MENHYERVVVTGIGIASPLGCDVATFWKRLTEGKSGIVALPDEDYGGMTSRIGALVNGFEEEAQFNSKDRRRMSRASRLALVAAEPAFEQAGLTPELIAGFDRGVILGSSIGGFACSDYAFRDYYLHGKGSALVIPNSMNYSPAANISIRFGFKGPVLSVEAACASSAHSIGYGFTMIRNGLAEIVVTGGADSPFSPAVVNSWCSMKALSTRNDTPATASRPFSADRDGMVLGEGAGLIVLESETSARRRGATILCEVKGYGSTGDSFHITRPTPEGPAEAMRMAMRDAGLESTDIDYINAHATATHQNDKNETEAIKMVFGRHAYEIPVVGNKSALGHSIGASGALELISCILTLCHQVIPPTINYTTPDPECDLDYVVDGMRRAKVENILSNSFAFGGSNGALIIGKYH